MVDDKQSECRLDGAAFATAQSAVHKFKILVYVREAELGDRIVATLRTLGATGTGSELAEASNGMIEQFLSVTTDGADVVNPMIRAVEAIPGVAVMAVAPSEKGKGVS